MALITHAFQMEEIKSNRNDSAKNKVASSYNILNYSRIYSQQVIFPRYFSKHLKDFFLHNIEIIYPAPSHAILTKFTLASQVKPYRISQ